MECFLQPLLLPLSGTTYEVTRSVAMARAGRKSRVQLTLDDVSKANLTAFLKAQKTPWGLARRAWAVLLVAGGESFIGAARQVGMAERHVRKWVYRFRDRGIEGLKDGKRTGRPPVFSPRGGNPFGQDGLRIA
jgi:hypothetical protein